LHHGETKCERAIKMERKGGKKNIMGEGSMRDIRVENYSKECEGKKKGEMEGKGKSGGDDNSANGTRVHKKMGEYQGQCEQKKKKTHTHPQRKTTNG